MGFVCFVLCLGCLGACVMRDGRERESSFYTPYTTSFARTSAAAPAGSSRRPMPTVAVEKGGAFLEMVSAPPLSAEAASVGSPSLRLRALLSLVSSLAVANYSDSSPATASSRNVFSFLRRCTCNQHQIFFFLVMHPKNSLL